MFIYLSSVEAEIAQLKNEAEKMDFLDSMNIKDSSLDKLILNGYALLDLITFLRLVQMNQDHGLAN